MPIYSIDGIEPQFEDRTTNWIAPDATLIGRLRIGRNVGIWFGAAMRGDNEPIVIGADTNIQEHVVMHTDIGFPLTVGRRVTIGHRALLHGCSVGDNSLIGMGAVVLNGASIGRNCLVGAGALVTEGKSFPDNSLIVGAPARVVRTLDDAAAASIRAAADIYVRRWQQYAKGLRRLG